MEEYLSGVELGRTRNAALREMNKAAMFEAFLFVLSAPFFSEHEAILRSLAQGDGEAAARAVEANWRNSLGRIADSVPRAPGSLGPAGHRRSRSAG